MSSNPKNSKTDTDFKRLVGAISANARTIAAITLGMVIAALLLAFVSTPSYKGTTKVLIDMRQQKVLRSEDVLPAITVDASAIESQVELLTSGKVVLRVLKELRDQDPKADPEAAFTDKQVQDFLSKLTAARKGLTYVVEVTYSANDPVKAAEIANLIAKAYIAEESAAMTDTAQKASAWLQERIKSLEPEVMHLDQTIQDYRAANGLISIGEQTVDERNLVEYIGKLGLSRAALAEAEAKLAFDKSKSSVSLQSQDDYEVAKLKVALMEGGLEAILGQVSNRRLKAIQLHELEREANAAKGLYEALLKRQREIQAEAKFDTVNARLIQEALPPAYPAWPRKWLFLFAGALGGLTIGVAYVTGRVIFFDEGYRPDDVSRRLGVDCTISVPDVRRPGSGDDKPGTGVAVAALSEMRIVDSAFDRLLDQLQRKGTKTVAVVSPCHGDGSTSIALGLCHAGVQKGLHVLLIDLDGPSMGLKALLHSEGAPAPASGVPGEAGLKYISEKSEGPGFWFCAWPEPLSAEKGRDLFARLLSTFRDRYDLIILDTGVLANEPEFALFADQSDGSIVVISAGQTPLWKAERMLTRLPFFTTKPAIFALNRVRSNSLDYLDFNYFIAKIRRLRA